MHLNTCLNEKKKIEFTDRCFFHFCFLYLNWFGNIVLAFCITFLLLQISTSLSLLITNQRGLIQLLQIWFNHRSFCLNRYSLSFMIESHWCNPIYWFYIGYYLKKNTNRHRSILNQFIYHILYYKMIHIIFNKDSLWWCINTCNCIYKFGIICKCPIYKRTNYIKLASL